MREKMITTTTAIIKTQNKGKEEKNEKNRMCLFSEDNKEQLCMK